MTQKLSVPHLNLDTADHSHHNRFVADNGGVLHIHYGASVSPASSWSDAPLASARLPPLPRCPAPSSKYTPRKVIEDHIHSFFSGESDGRKCYVLHGPGGSGKTQLALNFVRKYFYALRSGQKRAFSQVYWVNATSAETVTKSLEDIARSVDAGYTAEDALDWLAQCGDDDANWIMLFNDADDPKLDLAPYFPDCFHGNIIVTTRNFQAKRYGSGRGSDYAVSEMTHVEAQELLIRQGLLDSEYEDDDDSSSFMQDIADLIEKIDRFPLSIAQIAAYISTTSCTPREYIEMLDVQPEQLLRDVRQMKNPNGYKCGSLQATWLLSYDQLGSTSRHLLHLLANMHRKDIKQEIFERMCSGLEAYEARYKPLFTEDETRAIAALKEFRDKLSFEGSWDVSNFRKLIREVQSHSFVSVSGTLKQPTYSIHPVIQEWARGVCNPEDQALFRHQTIILLGTAATSPQLDERKLEDVQFPSSLVPHIAEVLEGSILSFEGCRNEFAFVYQCVGRSQEEVEYKEAYKEACEKVLGRGHPDTIAATETLSAAYHRLGRTEDIGILESQALDGLTSIAGQAVAYRDDKRYDEAAKLGLIVVEGRKKYLGEDDISTLSAMESLGVTYHNQGRHAEAAKIRLQVLEARKKKLGEDHRDTLYSLHWLGCTYYNQKNYKEAAKLQLQAVEGRKKCLGENDLDTLCSIHDLALTYYDLSRYEEAEKYGIQVVEGRKKRLGEEHRLTLVSMHNLGLTYHSQGRLEEAAKLKLQALEGRKKLFGEDDTSTLSSTYSLGLTYKNLGRYQEAAELILKSVEGRKKKLGEDHLDTLSAMHYLGSTYYSMGRYKEAEEFELQAVEGRKKRLGEDHLDTLLSMHELGLTIVKQERYEDGLKYQLQATEGRRKRLGEDHLFTHRSGHNLGLTYQNLGRHEEAAKCFLQAVEVRKKKLGEGHADTLSSMHNLGLSYYNLRRYEEAEKYESMAVEGRKKLGAENTDTLLSMHNIGLTYCKLGRNDDAIRFQREAAEGRKKRLGVDHLQTLSSMNNLAETLLRVGKLDEAKEVCQPALEASEQRWGAEHDTTKKAAGILARIKRQQEEAAAN